MNKISRLKKLEKQFIASFLNIISFLKKYFASFISFFLSAGRQKITIMLIPHSEKKVFNFRINVFLLFMTFLILTGSGGALFFLIRGNTQTLSMYVDARKKTEKQEMRAREYRDMLEDIFIEHNAFAVKLNNLIDNLDSSTIRAMKEIYDKNGSGGALNPVDDGHELSDVDFARSRVSELVKDYRYSIQAVSEINKMVNNYNKVIQDLPFGYPVKKQSLITSTFGFRIHPIHKVLDMHQGIDLANSPGTLIVSTAPGVVEKVEYNAGGYGWYLKISHKLGFSTLYAHLRSKPLVEPGDEVKAGQIIGYMGSTGASTASHLHYEIRLGNNLLDPWPFISN